MRRPKLKDPSVATGDTNPFLFTFAVGVFSSSWRNKVGLLGGAIPLPLHPSPRLGRTNFRYTTRREVYDARRPYLQQAVCVAFEEKKNEKIPPDGKRTAKPTSAQRPRPPRDGARKHMSHALAHTSPIPQIPSLWKSATYSSGDQ